MTRSPVVAVADKLRFSPARDYHLNGRCDKNSVSAAHAKVDKGIKDYGRTVRQLPPQAAAAMKRKLQTQAGHALDRLAKCAMERLARRHQIASPNNGHEYQIADLLRRIAKLSSDAHRYLNHKNATLYHAFAQHASRWSLHGKPNLARRFANMSRTENYATAMARLLRA